MSNPRVAYRVHPEILAAAKEAAREANVSFSEFLRHGLLVLLAGCGKLPDLEPGYERDAKSHRILARLNRQFPAVENWPELIPQDLVDRVRTRGW